MTFPFNLYLLAFGSSFIAALISLPLWRNWCISIGLVDDPGHRKIHDSPIALAGGFAVMTGLLFALIGGLAVVLISAHLADGSVVNSMTTPSSAGQGLVGAETGDLLGHGMRRRSPQLLAIFFGAAFMFVLGWLDDKHELSPRTKFGGQLFIASLVAISGIRITLFVPNVVFSYGITVLWILTVTNAFNFMDNMNGLCAGLGAICSFQFALSAAIHGQYLVATIAFTACGALLGFLPFNFPKASAFLGDAGSHLIGFLLAVLAILPHFYSRENRNAWAVLTPLLILAVPLVDLLWVVLLRWRLGQPFYLGDNNHLSHRLVRRGWSRSSAVLIIWLIATLVGAIGFL